MTVESLMRRELRTCRPSDTLAAAAHTLWEADCGALPVVDGEGRLIGIVTDRDVCMGALFRGTRLEQIFVGDVMSQDVQHVAPSTPVRVALDRLRERQLRRLPVVDPDGCLVGMVTLADVARAWGRRTRIGGRTLTADDVASTLAGVVRRRDEEPTAVMVVEIAPQPRHEAEPPALPAERSGKPKKPAKKRAPRKASHKRGGSDGGKRA